MSFLRNYNMVRLCNLYVILEGKKKEKSAWKAFCVTDH